MQKDSPFAINYSSSHQTNVSVESINYDQHISKTILLSTLFLTMALSIIFMQSCNAAEPVSVPGTDQPMYRIPLVSSPVKVDAFLDEDVWEQAVKVDANIEVTPGENIPAPVRTEARIAYDENTLYVAIIAYDPDPSQILAHLTDRDNLYNDDWVLFLVDTFNDQRRTYDFFCNPLGVQADQIETSSGGNGGDWDAIWDSAGRVTDEGYIVEMAIPFSSFSFPNGGGEHIWGFDIVRSYPRTVRHHIGAFVRDRNNNCYMCQAPKLIGFQGAKPGNDIEIAPTFSAGYSEERENETSGPMKKKDSSANPGITAKWSITSNMMLSATLNPDFSQVEADAAQMDINTRFPLYYSEKRPFFLEGADMFSTHINLVHTRTLAEPDWGVKLTGREGKHTMGFFTVRDNVTPLMFPGSEGADNTTLSMQSTGSVIRYKYDLGESSNVGIIMTDREGTDYHNRVAGIDGLLKLSQKDQIGFLVIGSNTSYSDYIVSEFEQPGSDFSGAAYGAGYDRDTENYHLNVSYTEFTPDMRADLGFITRTGVKESNIGGQYRWRQGPGHWYNWLSVQGGHNWQGDFKGNSLYDTFQSRFNYNGPYQSYVGINGEFGHNWYEGKKYRSNYLNIAMGLNPTGSSRVNLNINAGDQIDYTNKRAGKTFSINPGFDQNIGRHLSLNANHRYQRLTVVSGRLFDANVVNFRVKYQFTRRAFLRANLQYVDYDRNVKNYIKEERDNVDANSTSLFSQILFSYEINPQTVFYLGYSDNYRNRDYTDQRGRYDDSLTQTNRAFFTKIGYAWLP